MDAAYSAFLEKLGPIYHSRNESLKKYSTFRVGGPADIFVRVRSSAELEKVLVLASESDIPYFVIGGGTNLLISDEGFRGIIVKNESQGIRFAGLAGERNRKGNGSPSREAVFLDVESGVSVNRLVRYSIEQGLSGLQAFLGQPGSIGGGLYINAHNVGKKKYLGDALYRARIITPRGKVIMVDRTYFRFGYDKSTLQKSRETVLSAVFVFSRGDRQNLWEEAQESLEYRKKTQPYGVFTSGCTFRNISKSDAMRISTPEFTCSAGYILDSIGFKNKRLGDAYFSPHHANFIINGGSATAGEIHELIRMAKQAVKKRYNIDLTEEIVLVGNFPAGSKGAGKHTP